jgi:hypothetical protein
MIKVINKSLAAITAILAVSSGSYFGLQIGLYIKNVPKQPIIASETALNRVTRGIEGDNALISEHITEAAVAHNLERTALSCILKIESFYQLNAVSTTNDWGIGQINGTAWPEFNQQLLLTDLSYSINAAATVLAYYKQLKQAEEPITYYCRYNVGPGPLTGSERALKRNRACMVYLEKFRACHASLPFEGL